MLGAMNTSTFIRKEVRRTEQVASLAIARIRRAVTLCELAAAMNINVRADLRSLKHLLPSVGRAKREAERRAEHIVRSQLQVLAAVTDSREFLRLRGPLMADWRHLFGRFPRLASHVQSEANRLWAACIKNELQNQKPTLDAGAN